ncbi:hypothetical protein SAMN05216389_105199 [Oceanobacillus limi]|uniref:Uncharacterized protein n=1 Tax=Oceanobacillus limi TaxID=930131 RepID=A0A1I0BVK5_9BACI|nr:hypothetical protein [Oceanobacillus limi]SET10973.1 hypothetical protein SAMN05216389_105199 [Oceanobacillus limi]
MTKNSVFTFMGFVMFILVLSGCFGNDGITIPVGENGESITIGGDEEEGISIEAEDEAGDRFTLSSSTELPEDFPENIPFPSDYQIVSTMKVSENGEEGINVSYITESARVEEVWNMYKTFMDDNGYENSYEMTTDGFHSLNMQKGQESINLTITTDGEENTVTANISYFKSQEAAEE